MQNINFLESFKSYFDPLFTKFSNTLNILLNHIALNAVYNDNKVTIKIIKYLNINLNYEKIINKAFELKRYEILKLIYSSNCKITDKFIKIMQQDAFGTALIIYGLDHNHVMPKNLIKALFDKNYNLLIIGDISKGTNLDNITQALKDDVTFANTINKVFIQAHGSFTESKDDTLIHLSESNNDTLKMNFLMREIITITGNHPLDLLVTSCHGQLASKGLYEILPINSTMAILSEHQIINYREYIYNLKKNDFNSVINMFAEQKEKVSKTLSDSQFINFFSQVEKMKNSPLFAKVGVCKPRSLVTINAEEFKKVFTTISPDKLYNDIINYMFEKNSQNSLFTYEEYFLIINELQIGELPLLEIRELNYHYFNEAIGIAHATYQLYGPCSEQKLFLHEDIEKSNDQID